MKRIIQLAQWFAITVVLATVMTCIGAVTAWASPVSDAGCRAADAAWFNAAVAETSRDRNFWLKQYRISLGVCNGRW